MVWLTMALAVGATALDGILAGASLDQSIKQLPARHRIGVVAFSAYSQAADLGNGVLWYAILGVGAVVITIAAAVAGAIGGIPFSQTLPLAIAALLSILHSAATAQAAPTSFSQRKAQNDTAALARVFDRFARWQALRCALQVLTFAVMLWALVVSH